MSRKKGARPDQPDTTPAAHDEGLRRSQGSGFSSRPQSPISATWQAEQRSLPKPGKSDIKLGPNARRISKITEGSGSWELAVSTLASMSRSGNLRISPRITAWDFPIGSEGGPGRRPGEAAGKKKCRRVGVFACDSYGHRWTDVGRPRMRLSHSICRNATRGPSRGTISRNSIMRRPCDPATSWMPMQICRRLDRLLRPHTSSQHAAAARCRGTQTTTITQAIGSPFWTGPLKGRKAETHTSSLPDFRNRAPTPDHQPCAYLCIVTYGCEEARYIMPRQTTSDEK